MRLKVRIAARSSDLARLQAYRVADALRAAAEKKRQEVEPVFSFRASLGDLNQNDPLWKMPEKGVFTEDFLADLREGRADLVVHSWKDLPTEPRPDTSIVATLPRADLRDLFLFRRDRFESAKAARRVRVLTSSPRRAHNLKAFLETHLPFRAEVGFENVRGNIPTRLKKLLSQDVDALVVAKAALDRLLEAPEPEFADVQGVIREALAKTRVMVLPLSVNPTAAAQGALAIEVSRHLGEQTPALLELLDEVNCPETFASVAREREILASYGGGCHQKIGVNVFGRPYGELLFLRGLTDSGEVLDRVSLEARVRPPPASNEAAVFPRAGEAAAFYSREELPRERWAAAERESFLWVARESALPKGFRPAPEAVIWVAGVATWRKLAERGIWVSGSAEGLGESEPTRVEALFGERKIDWLKLTHESSALDGAGSGRAVATYRLRALSLEGAPRGLETRTHFFWMSGSSFDRALELAPSIKGAHHSCGPGLTHAHLRQILGPDALIGVFLSPEDWRRAVLPEAATENVGNDV